MKQYFMRTQSHKLRYQGSFKSFHNVLLSNALNTGRPHLPKLYWSIDWFYETPSLKNVVCLNWNINQWATHCRLYSCSVSCLYGHLLAELEKITITTTKIYFRNLYVYQSVVNKSFESAGKQCILLTMMRNTFPLGISCQWQPKDQISAFWRESGHINFQVAIISPAPLFNKPYNHLDCLKFWL